MDFDKNDVRVGAFVLAFVVIFLGAVLAVNRTRLMMRTYSLQIALPEIAGIDNGADVIYRGYHAGQVERVSVTYEPEFRFVVRFSVNRQIRLPAGTKVVVRGKGFSGARYLELVPSEQGTGIMLPPDAFLPVELEPDVLAKANDVLGEARDFVRRLGENGTAEDAAKLVHETRAAVAEFRRALANANTLMEEDRAALKGTLTKSDDLLTKRGPAIERSIKNVDEALTHLPGILKSAEELMAELKRHPWRLIRKGGDEAPPIDHKHDPN